MRDRLVELMGKQFSELVKDGDWNFKEMLVGVADYLLVNGVVVKDNIIPLVCCVSIPCPVIDDGTGEQITKKEITHQLAEYFMKNDELYELHKREDLISRKLVYEAKIMVCANKKGGAE